MRAMKDSGIPWIGEIPKEWETARIKDVVRHLKSGGTPETANDTFYCETGTPWVAIGDMRHGGFIEDTQKHLTENGINSKSLIVYPQGTLLYSIYASIGKVSILKIPAAVNQAILAISLNEKYNELYAKYVLMALEDYVFSFANGNTQFNLNANIVSNLPIPLLPPTEQQAIAEFLDRKCAEVDEMIALQEQIIEELKAYKQSVITEAVTKGLNPAAPMRDSGIEWIGQIPEHWEVKRLKYLCSIQTGNKDTQDADKDGAYPFYVRSPFVERSTSYSFEGEGILMAGDGAGAGRVFHHAFGKYAVHQRVYRLSDIKHINSNYLFYYISNLFNKVMDMGSAQSTVPSVRLPMLTNFRVCCPDIDEQQAIADYFDEKCADIDSLIQTKQSKIDSLKEYKKSIIYEYVTGKREVK